MASNTDVVKKNYTITCLYYVYLCVCISVFAIIKSISSKFPELLMMMPVACSTASQVGQYVIVFAVLRE